MTFEGWYNKTYRPENSDSHYFMSKTAWNAALDEAIKSVDSRGKSDFPDSLIEQVIIRLEKLKEEL